MFNPLKNPTMLPSTDRYKLSFFLISNDNIIGTSLFFVTKPRFISTYEGKIIISNLKVDILLKNS